VRFVLRVDVPRTNALELLIELGWIHLSHCAHIAFTFWQYALEHRRGNVVVVGFVELDPECC
jgi:hypothetical protein